MYEITDEKPVYSEPDVLYDDIMFVRAVYDTMFYSCSSWQIIDKNGDILRADGDKVNLHDEGFFGAFAAGEYDGVFTRLREADGVYAEQYAAVSEIIKNGGHVLGSPELQPCVEDNYTECYYAVVGNKMVLLYSRGDCSGVDDYPTNAEVKEITNWLIAEFKGK